MPATQSTSVDDRSPDGSALIVVDMISDWQFPDGERLLPRASTIAPAIAALKTRCRSLKVPVVYANDNHGRWRSDFQEVVRQSSAAGGEAQRITELLLPDPEDYFVLKPKHSVFFATPLDLLLQHLGAHRLILVGVASDQCIVMSASDAKMRDYEVVVPRDCIATQTGERDERTICHFAEAMRLSTPMSDDIELPWKGPSQGR